MMTSSVQCSAAVDGDVASHIYRKCILDWAGTTVDQDQSGGYLVLVEHVIMIVLKDRQEQDQGPPASLKYVKIKTEPEPFSILEIGD